MKVTKCLHKFTPQADININPSPYLIDNPNTNANPKVTNWPELLEAWLAQSSVNYHGDGLVSILLNQRLALTMLRAIGLRWFRRRLNETFRDVYRSWAFI